MDVGGEGEQSELSNSVYILVYCLNMLLSYNKNVFKYHLRKKKKKKKKKKTLVKKPVGGGREKKKSEVSR